MSAVAERVRERVKNYKEEIRDFKEHIRKYIENSIREIDESSEACYNTFNNLQMSIAEIKDPEMKEDYQNRCYQATYKLLSYIENDMDEDFCIVLFKDAKNFSKAFEHYSKYCTKMEKQYGFLTPNDLPAPPQKTTKKTVSKRK